MTQVMTCQKWGNIQMDYLTINTLKLSKNERKKNWSYYDSHRIGLISVSQLQVAKFFTQLNIDGLGWCWFCAIYNVIWFQSH